MATIVYNGFIQYVKGVDWKVLGETIDFFVVSFYGFNQCTPDYARGGIVPLAGKNGFTLVTILLLYNNIDD